MKRTPTQRHRGQLDDDEANSSNALEDDIAGFNLKKKKDVSNLKSGAAHKWTERGWDPRAGGGVGMLSLLAIPSTGRLLR
ncbi:hypothetical protein GE061_016423 [Apolygus lucorum]|uniref:Uncharacterized protein n=1 Tax=Apolygus lucorum TaxID=248454 RepID=A0A6A4JTH0_APOLU|nr:hypothetical protein GE061_016423 [Apolygus lucorum]